MPATDSSADIWTAGSYPDAAKHYLSMAGRLVERTGVGPADFVLDVGCGTGNATLTAARRGATVTGLDVTPELLEVARENAAVADLDVEWREGRATALPFDDDAFDATLSCLGHVYGQPPEAATRELLRVTKPGGRIGFTAWTPTGLYPFVAGVIATYLPPDEQPEFSEPPFVWGDSSVVTDRLGHRVDDLDFETRTTSYPALSPEHFWRELRTTSGPIVTFVDRVPEDDRPALRVEAIETIEPYFDPGTNAVELDYLLTTATVPEE